VLRTCASDTIVGTRLTFRTSTPMFEQLKTQFNVLKALTIRHMQGKTKGSRYGYIWLFLEPMIYILGFRLMRKTFGAVGVTEGMTPMMFYLLGILPLYACFDGMRLYLRN
jgi:ABC-type polysaccharide/polyol phosphate export permease